MKYYFLKSSYYCLKNSTPEISDHDNDFKGFRGLSSFILLMGFIFLIDLIGFSFFIGLIGPLEEKSVNITHFPEWSLIHPSTNHPRCFPLYEYIDISLIYAIGVPLKKQIRKFSEQFLLIWLVRL